MNAKLPVYLLAVASINILSADQRQYVWTYEYLTVPPGKGEVEVYHTASTPNLHHLEGTVTIDQQFELEVGMTERFDFAIYSSYIQEPDSALRFKGYKLRARYKIGKKDQYLLDPLLYFEYKGKPDFSEHGIETKLILSKDFESWNVSFNPIIEFGEEHGQWEMKFDYALGVSYQMAKTLSIGLEARGSGSEHYLGPVIAHGTKRLWVALGSAIAVSSTQPPKPRFQIRLLLGIGI